MNNESNESNEFLCTAKMRVYCICRNISYCWSVDYNRSLYMYMIMKAEKRMAIVQLQCMVKYNILFENERWQPFWQLLQALWQSYFCVTFPFSFHIKKVDWNFKKINRKTRKPKAMYTKEEMQFTHTINDKYRCSFFFLIYIWNQEHTPELRDEKTKYYWKHWSSVFVSLRKICIFT